MAGGAPLSPGDRGVPREATRVDGVSADRWWARQEDSSVRPWVYTRAWHAFLRAERDAYRRHGTPLITEELSRVAAEVRSTTALHLRSEAKDAIASLREHLSPAEQSLLVLRVDRGLSWAEVSAVMSTFEDPLDSRAAAKRFQRVKDKLRTLATEAGLLDRR